MGQGYFSNTSKKQQVRPTSVTVGWRNRQISRHCRWGIGRIWWKRWMCRSEGQRGNKDDSQVSGLVTRWCIHWEKGGGILAVSEVHSWGGEHQLGDVLAGLSSGARSGLGTHIPKNWCVWAQSRRVVDKNCGTGSPMLRVWKPYGSVCVLPKTSLRRSLQFYYPRASLVITYF